MQPERRAALNRACTLAVAVTVLTLPPVVVAADDDKGVYIGGTMSGSFARAAARKLFKGGIGPAAAFGLEVKGRIETGSQSDFVFDAGRRGRLAIPYQAIDGLVFGRCLERVQHGGSHPTGRREAQRYPWVGAGVPLRQPCLAIVYRSPDTEQGPHIAAFELDLQVRRRVFDAIERGSSRRVQFSHPADCSRYRTAAECAHGSPAELEGRLRVFVDSSHAESRGRITQEIVKARLGIELATRPDAADVILNFQAVEHVPSPATLVPPREGAGEVYVVQGGRLRVVLLFHTFRSALRAHPANAFGRAFVQAYRKANRGR